MESGCWWLRGFFWWGRSVLKLESGDRYTTQWITIKKKKFELYTLKESCSQICEFYLNEAVGGKKQTNKPKQQPSFIYHSTFQGLKPSYYLCVYLLTRTHSLKTVPVLLKPVSPVLTLYVAQRRCSGNINSTNEQIGQRENTPWKALLLWLMSEIYRKYLKMVDN